MMDRRLIFSQVSRQRRYRYLLCWNPSRCASMSSNDNNKMYVWEQTISSSTANASSSTANSKDGTTARKGKVLYKPISTNQGWEKVAPTSTSSLDSNSISSMWNTYKDKDVTNIQNLPLIHHFLPARYPYSVCPSYTTYASYCFMGSVAGSSAMVLSTQALLIAVGVGTHSAAPLAGALNWVMKDGIGQFGGVIFASQLGKGGIDFDYWRSKCWFGSFLGNRKKQRGNFQRGTADSNPKRWRMVAALALDLSTLLEICTPMMGGEWFLPCASIANIGKNVGFLAASASRAAIHQSISTGGTTIPLDNASGILSKDTFKAKTNATITASNLGDVTAKSGSQTIVASLLGTAIGIFLSRTFCSDHGTVGILAGFVFLSAIHQVSTYKAVKVVPLRSLDRHRLHIVLSRYISLEYSQILTPKEVAERESFVPLLPPDDSSKWLSVGDSLIDICPGGVEELKELMIICNTTTDRESKYERYILKVSDMDMNAGDNLIQITFLEGASDNDVLRGMFHAYISREIALREEYTGNERIDTAYAEMNLQIPKIIDRLQESGWSIGNGLINVECASSHRFEIQHNACAN